jgi:hypothetical protein
MPLVMRALLQKLSLLGQPFIHREAVVFLYAYRSSFVELRLLEDDEAA